NLKSEDAARYHNILGMPIIQLSQESDHLISLAGLFPLSTHTNLDFLFMPFFLPKLSSNWKFCLRKISIPSIS
ncbi:MAG: hypothetical protein KAV87_45435, partial [Desulfobacteraceae bacterium]|nr:hypothetical protein [Desulfobacteraceae bacterium]